MNHKQRAIMAFVRRNTAYFVLFAFLYAFMELGFQSGRRARPVPNGTDTQQPPHVLPFSPKAIAGGPAPEIATHPIPLLMEEAEENYRKKLSSQSRTLSAAVAEYRRRYRRPPPRGFDAWWKFCQTYDVKMVDEYDGLMEDLRPFFDLSGEEFKRRALQAGMLPSVDLVRVRGGAAEVVNVNPQFRDSEVSARARGLRSMMGKFLKDLPDMDLPVNAKAEGRVLVPWEHRVYPNMTKTDSSGGVESMLGGPFKPDWGEDGNVWEAWRRTCTPRSAARRLHASLRPLFAGRPKNYFKAGQIQGGRPYGDEFTFPKTTSTSVDFCEVPHAHYTQGHFFSDWRSVPVLYPILSPAKAKGFMDIRIPSHYYYGSTKRYTYGWDPINLELKEVDPMEVPWEEKKNKIFWRGATTGGGSHPPGFAPMYQRHRFLRMVSEVGTDTTTIVYPVAGTNGFSKTEVPVGELNEEMMDAAFVKAVSAASYPGGLKALMAAHRFGDSVPLGWHWRYKYLIDLDGMSYSGRFMSFLASDSVPIKSTVYEEFFTDWIQPWVHFIPLSSTYQEIYNVFTYFSGPTPSALRSANISTSSDDASENTSSGQPSYPFYAEGDSRLRRIARAGKEWKRTIGRTVDMEAYVYRLCIEWARLSADDRDAWSYDR